MAWTPAGTLNFAKPITIVGPSDDTPDPTKPYIKMTDPPSGEINNIWMGTRAEYDALTSRPNTTAHFVFRPEDL